MTSTSIERQELNTHSISRLAVVAAAALLLAGCAAPAPQAQVAVESDSVSIADAWVKSADEGMSAAFGVLSNDGDAAVDAVISVIGAALTPEPPASKGFAIERQAYTRIGGWWDRKGENEIDIVAENELDEEATFFEVKRKADNIDMKVLENKAAAFLRATGEFKGYKISYKGLSMDDM